MKPTQERAHTLSEKLGFRDPDLGTPAHDELVLWIGEHIRSFVEKGFDPWSNLEKCRERARTGMEREFASWQAKIEKLLQESRDEKPRYGWGLAAPREFRLENAEEIQQRLRKVQDELAGATEISLDKERLMNRELELPKEVLPVKIETRFEVPVTTGREYIVGFVDVRATVTYPRLAVEHLRYDSIHPRDIIGTEDDPLLAFYYPEGRGQETIYFEAKPRIPSLGELLRQIRTYQEYVRGRFVVVSPDTRFRQVIEDQGIEFWEAPK